MQIEQWPIGNVKPYDKNPRNNDEAVAAVAASLQEFGFRQPIVVDTQGVIIAEVDPASDAAEKGLKAGDIILEVSGDTVNDPKDVVSGIKKAQELKRSAILLHVKSGEQKRLVAVQLKEKKG